MNPIQTIRYAINTYCPEALDALAALAELERTHYTPEDMADASAKGFRDGVASVAAGQEPIAEVRWAANVPGTIIEVVFLDPGEIPEVGTKLYAAPVAQQPQAEAVPGLTEFLADLSRSRTKYPNNARMWDGLMGELDELRRAYHGDGDQRAEAFDVAVCAFRIATEGDAGDNRLLAQAEAMLTDQEVVDLCDGTLTTWSQVRLARAVEQAVRAKMGAGVPMPPEDWSVFNTGAEVASGLTWAEAWDYMTPSRIDRGWTAVCVADKSNIGIVGKEGGNVLE